MYWITNLADKEKKEEISETVSRNQSHNTGAILKQLPRNIVEAAAGSRAKFFIHTLERPFIPFSSRHIYIFFGNF